MFSKGMVIAPIIFLVFAIIVAVFSFFLYESDALTSKGIQALMRADKEVHELREEELEKEVMVTSYFYEEASTTLTLQEAENRIKSETGIGVMLSCQEPFVKARTSDEIFLIKYDFCSLRKANQILGQDPPTIKDCLSPEQEVEDYVNGLNTDYEWGYKVILKSEDETRIIFSVFKNDATKFSPYQLNQGNYYSFIC